MKQIAVITPISHLPGVSELIKTKGETFFLEKGNKEEVRKLLITKPIDVIFCNPNHQNYKIDKELLEGTNVSVVNTASTGLNHIDLDYCRDNNIVIQSHKNDFKLINQLPSTSELAFGLMLDLLRNITQSQSPISNYEWDYTKFIGRQVKDLKIGIIGYGRLGRMMAKYCEAFGAEVYVYDPYLPHKLGHIINWVGLDQMFQFCDVISLHVHVTDETKYMINKDLLGLSKKDLYIINTSRGEIVNEIDIVEGLTTGTLTGYGTDVIENEFDDLTESPIIKAMNQGKNIITTPHVGGMTIEGQTKAYKWAINKL